MLVRSAKSLGKRPAKFLFRCRSTANVPESELLKGHSDWSEFLVTRSEFKSLMKTFEPYGSTQTPDSAHKLRDSLHRPTGQTTISTLLAAGAHFGHASSRMNPNFMPYAYGTRAGITIIDLDHTLPLLRRAANLVRAVAAADGSIVFIGTRPDLKPVVEKAADRLGSQGYHVGDRWLPGTLTNKIHIFGHGSLRNEQIVPDLVILLNPIANMNAIRECAVNHVPTIGIIDSNADPRLVMYPIPANDESTRTAEIIGGVLSVAGREGVALREQKEKKIAERTDMAQNRANYRPEEGIKPHQTFDY